LPVAGRRDDGLLVSLPEDGGTNMQWTTPSYTDIRFGFEITLYIATR
jgi:coenzyme PQQ precursor peptide PqqA